MDPNTMDPRGNTPLHLAACTGLLPVVRWLCEDRGAMVTVTNSDNVTPLQLAVQHGRTETAAYLRGRIALIGGRKNRKSISDRLSV